MKKIFCANQQKTLDYSGESFKIFCAIYGKECPYTKQAKAEKKCSEAYFIPEHNVDEEE